MAEPEQKKRILMLYQQEAPFIQRDVDILSNEFFVETRLVSPSSKISVLPGILKQFFSLFFSIKKYDAVICQGASYYSFAPALAGWIRKVPVAVIAIGTDCVSFPSIDYGNFRKKILGWFTRKSFSFSKVILPVHSSLILSDYQYFPEQHPKQGIKFFCPNLKTSIIAVNNGFDLDFWKVLNETKREKGSFITVSGVITSQRLKIKGIDLFIEMAKKFPQNKFTIVGELRENIEVPANITFFPFASGEELLSLYNRHEFYVQLSISEGFPNAICEAMLCGCVPVASAVASLPEIVGDCGYILNRRDPAELIKLFEKCLANNNENLSKKSFERIKADYPLNKRAEKLIGVMREITGTKSL